MLNGVVSYQRTLLTEDMIESCGALAVSLSNLSFAGLPVAPGIVIPREVHEVFQAESRVRLPEGLPALLGDILSDMEEDTGKKLSSKSDALFVSIRNGDTGESIFPILGVNAHSRKSIYGSPAKNALLRDFYRNYTGALGLKNRIFDARAHMYAKMKGKSVDELDYDDFAQNMHYYLASHVLNITSSAKGQILFALRHALSQEGYPIPLVIQAKPIPSAGSTKYGAGFAYTRCPISGESRVSGEFQYDTYCSSQAILGETLPLSVEEEGPDHIKNTLSLVSSLVETRMKQTYSLEFLFDEDSLSIIGAGPVEISSQARIASAVSLAHSNVLSKADALSRVSEKDVMDVLVPHVSSSEKPFARGQGVSPGVISGIVIKDREDAQKYRPQGALILVTPFTTPEQFDLLHEIDGILTFQGGPTSHAAVVARGMGKPCVVGAQVSESLLDSGQQITIDGSTGFVYQGEPRMELPRIPDEYETLMHWAQEHSALEIRANAEMEEDIARSLSFGAKGLGLVRTEHMLMDPAVLNHVRLAVLFEGYAEVLGYIEHYHSLHLEKVLEASKGFPVAIRLADFPLHEILPSPGSDQTAFLSFSQQKLLEHGKPHDSKKLHDFGLMQEHNPMLGRRGARLGITSPGFYSMQIKAIIRAALNSPNYRDDLSNIEIMVPMAMDPEELSRIKSLILEECAACKTMPKIGAMIETPRAALLAGEIAPHVDFISFGTNDLTQMTLGISRDDAGTFLQHYVEEGIFQSDPFVSLDKTGVGRLIQMAIEQALVANPDLKIGICGEHGGDPKSIQFFIESGVHYISCSAFRIPIAQLAAAKAAS